MSEPGWYPDPGGALGEFRYWDGASWSAQTTRTPGTSGPRTGSTAPGSAPSKSRSGLVVAALALVVLLVLGLVIWRLNSPGGVAGLPGGGGAEDTNSAAPTISAWDETSTASPTPNDEPTNTGGQQVDCLATSAESNGNYSNGRMFSSNISAPLIDTWQIEHSLYIGGLVNTVAQQKSITATWESNSSVSGAPRAAFPSIRFAAAAISDCFATSGYYRGLTGRKTVLSEAVTVDGHAGYRIRTEAYVSDQGPTIPGDVIDVIAIDTGDLNVWGMYVSAVTIGDSENQAKVDAVIADIRVNR